LENLGQILKYLFFLILIISCNPKEKTTQESTKAPIYYRWDISGLQEAPLNVVLAQEFLPQISKEETNPSELNLIEMMAQKWNLAHPSIEFYSLPFTVGSNRVFTNLDDYLDDEIGIYFSKEWYRELSPNSLAVTQFFGKKKNVGTPDEFFELVHGDILVNFRDFEYFTDSDNKVFDLLTVVLHEMGHLLGLPHTNNPSIQSVMSPYLERGEKRRDLTQYDFQNILKHYPVSAPATPAISSLLSIEETEILEKYIVELRSDGQCYHYLNGQFLFSH
jgi:Matrixin